MAMFSKRHYEVVARVVQLRRNLYENAINAPLALVAVRALQRDFVTLFTADNPRFDAERFNKACEPKGRGE